MSAREIGPGECTLPPALDDLTLIAALDNECPDAVQAHLRACPSCARRAREFESAQQALRRRLFRALCPPADDLLAFAQRVLNPDRFVAIAEHLEACAHCARELRMLESVTRPDSRGAPVPSLPRRVVLRPEAPSALALAGGALYGRQRGGHGCQYLFRSQNAQLVVEVDRAADRPGRPARATLTGILTSGDSSMAPAGAPASLLSGGQVISTATVDDFGCFLLADIPGGEHSLSVRLPACELVIETLRI